MAVDILKMCLTHAGRRTSPRTLRRLDFLVSYLTVGKWMCDRGYWPDKRYADRPKLFEVLFEKLADRPVLYLEFGVYQGYSMRLWSHGLKHPGSQLIGFDSFQGLPEHWHEDAPVGRFDLGGTLPHFDDPRVNLVKGWFEDSLESFQLPPHDMLVVNCDADIYSSTKFVLGWLQPHLRAGDILYFDEFFDRHQELRALDELLREHPMALKLVGATRSLNEVAFQIESIVTSPSP